MAISLDHSTSPRTIYIPKADTTLVQAATGDFPEIRSLDMEVVHNDLRTLQAQEKDTIFPTTHEHTQEDTLGAVTYPRRVRFSDEYQVELEDGQYRVRLEGGDTNLEDRQVANQVSISTFNSAGNSVTVTGSGVTQQDKDDIENQIFDRIVENGESFEVMTRLIRAAAAGDIVVLGDGTYKIKSADGNTDRIDGEGTANNGRDVTAVDGS